MESLSSTPFESAACSPRHSTDTAMTCMYSSSSPVSPVRGTFDLKSAATSMGFVMPLTDQNLHVQLEDQPTSLSDDDFDFSARFSEVDQQWPPASMSSADELFCNGRIRPLWYRCEDLIEWHPNQGTPPRPDDGDHFDFKSSADYDFRRASALQFPYSFRKLHSYGGYDCESHDEVLSCAHVPGSRGKKKEVSGTIDMQNPKDKMGNRQAIPFKVEETRGRYAGNNKEGGARRTRSLSPMRVFHMDDELPKQSFETDQSTHSIKEAGGDERVLYDEGVAIRAGRRTLKELLHASSRAEHRSLSKDDASRLGEKAQQQNINGNREMNMKRRNAHTLWLTCLTKEASSNTTMGSCPPSTDHHRTKHSPATHNRQHYVPHRVNMEQIRHQTSLPYRHGLLSCLSFTSRSYHSVAGMGIFHAKSER